MKTKKYTLYVNVIDMMTFTVPLTKKEYQKKLASLRCQVAKSQHSIDESFIIESEERTIETEKKFDHIFSARLGGTEIELHALECKPGYQFS